MSEIDPYEDAAVKAAMELHESHRAGIEEGTIDLQKDAEIMTLEARGRKNRAGEGSKLKTRSMMDAMRFKFRPEDQLVLEQIKAGANAAFQESFNDALSVVDDFYSIIRVPKMRDDQPIKDTRGRVVWETDEYGSIKQDMSRATGQDIETTLFRLQEVRLYLAGPINNLMLAAMYSKHLYDDARSDAYSSVLEGTIGDREARANRESRQDKYAAFFRFWLYSQGDAFMRELQSLQRLLERMRDWQIRSQPR